MDTTVFDRIPPQHKEAEQSILGAMLLDKDVISTVTEVIKAEDFYFESHKEIFESIIDLFMEDKPIDIITVSDKLNQRGTLQKTGGMEYLSDIVTSISTTSNIRHYSKIVEEKSLLRKLIKASSDISNMSYEGTMEVSDVLDGAEKRIFDIIQGRNRSAFAKIRDVLGSAFDRLEELYNNQGVITGIPTGFIDLDEKTSGLQNSDLVLIAARPAMGKTSFVLNIAQHVAVQEGIPVAVFSLEMSKEQLVNRILSCEALIELQKLKTGKLESEDWTKLASSLGPLSEAPIYIDDNANTTVMEIRSKCRKLKLEKNLGLVVIDYLQLMQGHRRSESRQQEISEISRSLKIMAKELNVPVIALSQLSRASETRADHRPILSDLRESGAIEQDADIVMFLYRDDYYNENSEKKNISEVIIAKHRNGSTGTVELAWLGKYTKFGNVEKKLQA